MKFLELVKSRISVREYTSKEVDIEKLEYIIECARLAPSAANYQPWQFIIVKNDDVKCSLHECYHAKWFTEAPVYIIACADVSQSWKRSTDGKEHADIDVAIAVEHICLAATEQGLGTCWVCNFDAQKCSEILKLPTNIQPVAIIPIGYTTQEISRNPNRKPTEEIIRIIK